MKRFRHAYSFQRLKRLKGRTVWPWVQSDKNIWCNFWFIRRTILHIYILHRARGRHLYPNESTSLWCKQMYWSHVPSDRFRLVTLTFREQGMGKKHTLLVFVGRWILKWTFPSSYHFESCPYFRRRHMLLSLLIQLSLTQKDTYVVYTVTFAIQWQEIYQPLSKGTICSWFLIVSCTEKSKSSNIIN
jgi:hypothetical protein